MLFSDAKEAVAAITDAVKEMEEAWALTVGTLSVERSNAQRYAGSRVHIVSKRGRRRVQPF